MKKFLSLLFISSLCCNAYALNSLQDNSIIINKHKIHYYVTGTGNPLILLTGYGVTSNFWPEPFISCLAETNKVYLLDYQGINTKVAANPKLSIKMLADDTNNFINQLQLDHPKIAAWSIGGAVALQLAYDHPHSISKLILFSPILPNKNIFQPAVKKPNFKSQDNVLNFVFANNFYNYSPSDLNFYKPQILNMKKTLFPDGKQTRLEHQAIKNWVNNNETTEKMSHIKVPITVVLSMHDNMLNYKVQASMIKSYATANTITLNNAGHAAFYQQPESMCNIIVK